MSVADLKRAWLLRMLGLSESVESISDLESQVYGGTDPFQRNFQLPTGVIATSLDRRNVSSAAVTIVSARLQWASVYLYAGQTADSIGVSSGNVAAVTPTHQWAALYDYEMNLVDVTEDKTTEAWAASTLKEFAFASPVAVPESGIYRTAFCIVAATPINLIGTTKSSIIDFAGEDPLNQLNGQGDSGLTDPASAPATIGSIGATNTYPYMHVSGS